MPNADAARCPRCNMLERHAGQPEYRLFGCSHAWHDSPGSPAPRECLPGCGQPASAAFAHVNACPNAIQIGSSPAESPAPSPRSFQSIGETEAKMVNDPDLEGHAESPAAGEGLIERVDELPTVDECCPGSIATEGDSCVYALRGEPCDWPGHAAHAREVAAARREAFDEAYAKFLSLMMGVGGEPLDIAGWLEERARAGGGTKERA